MSGVRIQLQAEVNRHEETIAALQAELEATREQCKITVEKELPELKAGLELSISKIQKRLAQFELQLGREEDIPSEKEQQNPDMSSWKKSKTALVFAGKVKIPLSSLAKDHKILSSKF